MRLFTTKEIREAWAYAAAGGQALHLMTGEWAQGWGGPVCFRRAREFGHLLDQDAARLIATAKRLGVKRIVLGRAGQLQQHVDLCGKPLERAKAECTGLFGNVLGTNTPENSPELS